MSKNLTSRLSFPAWTALVVLAIVVLPLSMRVVAAADERTEAAGDLPEASTTAEAADSAERLAIAPDAPAPSQNGRTLEARLETPIKVHFTETPLDQALDALSNDVGVDIYLDPRGLEQEGVASDAPVTVELKNEVALKSALNLLLKPLHLTFVVEDEVIKVTSEEAKRTNVSTIQPSSVLSIRVIGALPEQRIADRFAVDPEGYVDLGRPYGRVHVAGWTAEHAETVLAQVLQTKIRHPKVEVSPIDAAAGQSGEPNAARAYRISAGDLLQVSAVGVDPEYPLHDVFGVEPGGTLALGPTYGRVKVAGQTLEESEAAVRDTLELKFKDPRVQITLAVPQSGRTDPFAGDLRAYSAAHHAASSSGESTPEELAVLREHVAFLKAQFDAIDAKFRAGNRGGEAEIREMTGYELETARADLAQAEGRLDEAAAHLKEAEAFAEHALKSVQATYDVGRITHDVVLQAAHNLAEIKRRLARHQQSQMPPSANYHIAELPRAANRSADARTRAVSKLNPSARAWKQDVENKQRAYERAQTLSNKGVISAAELGQAKVDYEFSVANFESALRRLKHSQLLVELAETEYEQALASNKAVPNSVSEFELRKLRIKVELAKLEMGEAE